jgi:hypothetical protein
VIADRVFPDRRHLLVVEHDRGRRAARLNCA